MFKMSDSRSGGLVEMMDLRELVCYTAAFVFPLTEETTYLLWQLTGSFQPVKNESLEGERQGQAGQDQTGRECFPCPIRRS